MTTDPKKKHGDASTIRVSEALIKAAGEIMLRSKVAPARRIEMCAQIGEMQKDFEALTREAWDAE